jgi:hypothetical protein
MKPTRLANMLIRTAVRDKLVSAIIDAPLPRKPHASPRVKLPKPQPIDLAVLLAPSLDAQL